jgi:hypothetical protein
MNAVHLALGIFLAGFTVGVWGLLRYLDRQDEREEAAYVREAPTYFIGVDDYHPLVASASRDGNGDDHARQSGGE